MKTEKRLDRIGDGIVSVIRQVLDVTALGVETVGKTLQGIVPKVPWPQTLTPPTATEVAGSVLRFQEQVVQAQKEFVLRVVEAIEPLVRPIRESKPARPAKAA